MGLVLDIRSLRQTIGVKQKDLAARIGISVNELMRLERGLDTPTEIVLAKLCDLAGVEHCNLSEGLFVERLCGEGYVTAKPSAQTTVKRRRGPARKKKYVMDLFCGVGGFSFGFEMTGRFEVVAGIDLLGDRLNTFAANHATANAYGQDIRSIDTEVLDAESPRPFVIVGGPPCQGFSSIRPFRNIDWNDPRNNLAEEFCRVVGDLLPEWIVFENVVGLLTHEKGRTLKAIVEAFEALGYRTSMRVLNCANYGVPQRRERLVIVGSRKGKAFKWPEPTHRVEHHRSMVGNDKLLIKPEGGLFSPMLLDAITIDEAIHDLPPVESGKSASSYRNGVDATAYESMMRNGAEVLTMHEATAHSEDMLKIIRVAGTSIRDLPKGMVTSGFSSCYSRLAGDEPSVTLTVNFVHPASNRCIHPQQDRALTPREGARLQGFVDTFEFKGSRTQIVKQIGNAVPPLFGKTIAMAILESD